MGPNIQRILRHVAMIAFMALHVTSSAKMKASPVYDVINEQPKALHVTSSAKTNARPVYEVINEQPKADDRQIKTGQTNLPYGNPLALGNSHTNALLHAHNQQAMFNAERVRQHKAQILRWTKTPLIDSYMRAYHESQENHQLAQEQQQAKVEEKTQAPRQRDSVKKTKQLDPVELSKEEGGKGRTRNRTRNHRSFGSVEYQHVEPRYHKLYFPSAYNQNPMRPNAVNEMIHLPASNLYTGVAVNGESAYPKYYPAQDYQSVQNIETLNSLLNKNPGDQLTEFNALINSAKANSNHDKELETPIDLYFYLKDPSSKGSEHYAHISNIKDHTPIKEEMDKVNESKLIGFREHSNAQTTQLDPTASKNIQFINTELTNQILSTGYNPLFREDHSIKEAVEPEHQALPYGQQATYNDVDNTDSDLSERYLHHNGVQHLNDDGLGVSAYDEENVSMDNNFIYKDKHSRSERSIIGSEQFVSIGNHSVEVTKSNVTQEPIAEPLVRVRSVPKNKLFREFGTFLTTPDFAIGEAVEHNAAYPFRKVPSRNYGTSEIFYDEQDYGNNDDIDTDYDYETSDTIPQRNHFTDTFEAYAPSETYIQNIKFNSKFNQRPKKRIPNDSSVYDSSPSSSEYGLPHSPNVRSVYGANNFEPSSPTYGPPFPTSTYSIPQSFQHNIDTAFNPSSPHLPEPVYLLTQSQLTKLIGHHNLNIEHLDVYQLSKSKRPGHHPKRYKKRSPHRNTNFRQNILKLHNLHII